MARKLPRFHTQLAGLAIGLASLILFNGCGGEGDTSQSSNEPVPASGKLALLVIGDPDIGDSAARFWNAQGRGDLEVTNQSIDEFLASSSTRPKADAIIYPNSLLGEMVARNLIAPLPRDVTNDADFARRDILDIERTVVGAWGDSQYAFSLGTPQFVLLYREDYFADHDLAAPTTWPEYVAIAKQLHDLPAPDNASDWRPVLAPLSDGWAAKTLFAHAASYVRTSSRYSDIFDVGTLRPLVGEPPYVRALEELTESLGDSAPHALSLSPNDVTNEVFAGNCAMAIGLIHGTQLDDSRESEFTEHISVASLPGSSTVYSFRRGEWEARESAEYPMTPVVGVEGMLGSVVYLSRRTSLAQDFLLWLCGPQDSEQMLPDSLRTHATRSQQLLDKGRWIDQRLSQSAQAQYATIVIDGYSQTTWFGSIRVPGAYRYQASLSGAIEEFINNDADATVALNEVVTEWHQITNEIGKSEQIEAYEQSLLLK